MADYIPTRKKIALDNRKLTLSVPCPSAQGKYSTLAWRLVSNNPRIDVYTNDPQDNTAKNNNGKISAAMDAPTFSAFVQLLKETISSAVPVKYKIENKNFIFPGGKRSEKPVIVSELVLIKDDEGVIWLSVLSSDKERPKIKFPLINNEYHNFFKEGGVKFSKGEASQLYARGYVNLIESMMNHLLITEWVEPEIKKKPEGGGYKNNNQNNSQNDDDLMF